MPLSRASIELHLLLCHVLAVRVRESSKPCGMVVTIIITILLLLLLLLLWLLLTTITITFLVQNPKP